MNLRSVLVASAVGALMSSNPASAAPSTALYEALAAGDTSPAKIGRLLSHAEAGNGEAAEVAAFLFATGRPVTDLGEAFYWYLRAALAGQPNAMDNGVLVWRSMTIDQQREAERRLRAAFTAPQVSELKGLWADSFARIPPPQPKKPAPPKKH